MFRQCLTRLAITWAWVMISPGILSLVHIMVSDIQRVDNFALGWRVPWTMVRTMGDSTTTRPFGLGAPMRTWGNTTTKRGAAMVTAFCQVSWHKLFRSAQMYVELILPDLWSFHNQVSAETLMSVEPVSNPMIGPVKTLATHGYATTARSCVAIVLKKEAHLVVKNPMASFWLNQSTPRGVQISAGT